MQDIDDIVTVRLQIRLNNAVYEKGCIPHDMYFKVNDALQERLCELKSIQAKSLNNIV